MEHIGMLGRAAAAVLMVMLAACSSDSKPEKAASPRIVAETAIGAPTGAPVTATIGPAGGTLVSGDGKVTVVVPANAVSSATEFSVTPIETTSPGGVVSYRLGPEAAKFAQEATIVFKYSDADVAGSHPAFLNIAYQDSQRRWRRSVARVDEGQRTVSTQTAHLSDWSVVQGMQIRPFEAMVAVNKKVHFAVQFCDEAEDAGDDDAHHSLVWRCHDDSDDVTPIVSANAVNGIAGGNASIGRVTSGAVFQYLAPRQRPTPNPVSVSVEAKATGDDGRPNKTIMFAQVTVMEDSNAPEVPLPHKYYGSGKISLKSGGEGTGAALLNYEATYEVTGGRAAGHSVGEYTLSGSLIVTGGSMELPNCSCSIQGRGAPVEVGLGVNESDKTQSLAVSAFVPVAIQCTPSEGRRSCPSSSVVAVTWSNHGRADCPGSTATTFTDVRHLAGIYVRTCRGTQETASWSLTGE